jgi:hypothetical protein
MQDNYYIFQWILVGQYYTIYYIILYNVYYT